MTDEKEWFSLDNKNKREGYDWILMIDGSPEYGLYVHNVVSGGGFYKEKPKNKWTNNQAEYHALILALEYHIAYNQSAMVFSDSELLVKQFNGECKCYDPNLQNLLGLVKQTIRIKKQEITLRHIHNDKNLAGLELEKIRKNRIKLDA